MNILLNYDDLRKQEVYFLSDEIERLLQVPKQPSKEDMIFLSDMYNKIEDGQLGESTQAYSEIAFLLSKLSKYSSEYQTANFTTIKSMLNSKNIIANDDKLFNALIFLLVNRGYLKRDDFWEKEPEYTLLTKHYYDSAYSRSYYSFTDDSNRDKTFLLISDTHIGNNEIENMKLINKLYNYAIAKGADKCFHLGDLFEGKILNSESSKEEFLRRINKFKNEYPRPNQKEMMTYCLKGNHDEIIENFICNNNEYWCHNDLRRLTLLNPSFYMFPRNKWQSTFSDINFHFSHRLYLSGIIEDFKLHNLSEISEYKRLFDSFYSVNISGHLHKGIIYTIDEPYLEDKEKLFLGVPSTSNININKPVAYLINTYNDSSGNMNNMDISVLNYDNNNRIYESDIINWSFKNKNKVYRKIL